jgi:NAD(P)-dependent dehydrogenase (short-subunit alcohol dehydrogenase family)
VRGLKDKVVIVAGAAPGNIGAATAVRLAEEGAVVVAADLNAAAAQAVVDSIRALGGRAAARSFNITDEASYKELVDFTVKEFGKPDGLFNVAAPREAATCCEPARSTMRFSLSSIAVQDPAGRSPRDRAKGDRRSVVLVSSGRSPGKSQFRDRMSTIDTYTRPLP